MIPLHAGIAYAREPFAVAVSEGVEKGRAFENQLAQLLDGANPVTKGSGNNGAGSRRSALKEDANQLESQAREQ